jgi:anti-anti-sigma regulatory factor
MFEITVSTTNGFAVIGFRGAMLRGLACHHLIDVVKLLCECGERYVALHAAAVSAIDSDGLAALVDCHAAMCDLGGCFIIKRPSAALRLALRRSGLETVLEIVDSPEHERSWRYGPSA